MTNNKPTSPVILFITTDIEAYGIGGAIRDGGYELVACETATQALKVNLDKTIDLVLINARSGHADEYCRELRLASSVNLYPIIVIGPDTHSGATCAAAFEAGADDFVPVPVPPAALIARLEHHLSNMRRVQAMSSISAQASSAELAMILQFLEAEQKTGRMVVKRHNIKGSMVLQQGMLIQAEARNYTDVEAVAEMLCWTSSSATFIEEAVDPAANQSGMRISDVLTKAMAQVASYRAARRRLPPPESVLVPGGIILDSTATHTQRVVYEHAIGGHTVEDILREDTLSSRTTTITLLELLDSGHLAISTPLFQDYSWHVYRAYPDQRLHRHMRTVKAALGSVAFPLKDPTADPADPNHAAQTGPPQRHRLAIAEPNWSQSAPQLVIAGNHPEHATTFLESLSVVHESMTRLRVPRRRDLSGIEALRFFFVPEHPIDIVSLPAVMDRSGLRWLDQHYRDLMGVILFTADTTTDDTRRNIRLLRQLWGRFKGLYYLAVPKLPNRNQEALFTFECRICGHTLSVEIDRAGADTRCPACNAALTIPDCMDCLAKTLSLPDDVAVLQVQTNEALHARDLMLVLLSDLLASGDADHAPEAEWSNETWSL